MNFRIKTRGLYDIIEPVLDENEVFDSSLLKESINSLIASASFKIVTGLITPHHAAGAQRFAAAEEELDQEIDQVRQYLHTLEARRRGS